MDITCYTSVDMLSNMYVISENDHALVIDPSRDNDVLELVKQEAHIVDKILLTHEHCDHVSGAQRMRSEFGSPVFCSETCAKNLMDSRLNYSRYFNALAKVQSRIYSGTCVDMEAFVLQADETFTGEAGFTWQGHYVIISELPGHSQGSIGILLDNTYLFIGDTLIWNEKTITRFIGGSKKQLEQVTMPWLYQLDPAIYVYPGHFESFVLGDRLKLDTI